MTPIGEEMLRDAVEALIEAETMESFWGSIESLNNMQDHRDYGASKRVFDYWRESLGKINGERTK